MNPRIFLACCIFAAELFTGAMAQAGCKQLFHHAPVQAVVVPQVYYFAGQATQDEALIRKAIRAELPAIIQQLQAQPQRAEGVGPITLLTSKCARCHTGEAAKGGVDLTQTIDAGTFRRCVELMGTGKDSPSAMKPVLSALTAEDKGRLMEELLQLSARPAAAKPEPQVLPPEPEAGVLR